MIAETPQQIQIFVLLSLKSRLKLEALGMKKSSGSTAASTARKILGSKERNRAKLYEEFSIYLARKVKKIS
jgi:hypothetical protein